MENQIKKEHDDTCIICSYPHASRYPLKYLYHFLRERVGQPDLTTAEVMFAEDIIILMAGRNYVSTGEAEPSE